MASCSYCNSAIFLGGVRDGNLRFCNTKCQQNGVLVRLAAQVPPDILDAHVAQVHAGSCPCCQTRSPVDVHTSYRIWSILILTSWGSRPIMSCRACAIKRQIGDTIFCLFLGSWGFPWGIIFTPIQIIKNLTAMAGGPNPRQPSDLLRRFVSLNLAAHYLENEPCQA
jgi:hypothetical protein